MVGVLNRNEGTIENIHEPEHWAGLSAWMSDDPAQATLERSIRFDWGHPLKETGIEPRSRFLWALKSVG